MTGDPVGFTTTAGRAAGDGAGGLGADGSVPRCPEEQRLSRQPGCGSGCEAVAGGGTDNPGRGGTRRNSSAAQIPPNRTHKAIAIFKAG